MKTLRIKKWTNRNRDGDFFDPAPWKIYRVSSYYSEGGDAHWDRIRDVQFTSEHDALKWVAEFYEKQRRAEHTLDGMIEQQ